MDFLVDVADWFADPARWSGRRGIPFRTLQHLQLAVIPTLIALALAAPPAAYLAHRRAGAFVANATVNVGRAIPSFGVLVVAALFAFRWGLSARFWPIVIVLVLLALPPIFTNTYTAIRGVDPAIVEAARGMGQTEREVLLSTELPLGSPVVLAGIRIAFLQVLATVPLAAVVGDTGGLGIYIILGLGQGSRGRTTVFAGALVVALLTVLMDALWTRGERLLLPAGIRRTVRLEDVADTAVPA